MINRILIRIKVVQILYSYLLSKSEFKIDAPPANASRDRRFGYAVYLDALMLVQELSGIKIKNPDRSLPAIDIHPKLKLNRVGRALADNPDLSEYVFKNISDLNLFAPKMQYLADKVAAQSVFADYSKKRNKTLSDDVKFWAVVLETLFLNDPEVSAILRQNPDFSLTGLHYGIMQAVATLNDYNDSRAMYQKAKNDLEKSLMESYNLYFALFALMVELTAEAAEKIEMAKEKHLATAEDLNPNTRFIDNAFIKYIESREEYRQFIKDTKFTWIDSTGLLKSLLDDVMASETYEKYMSAPSTDWNTDCEFWRKIMKSVILNSEALDSVLEAKSIYWNDDLPTIGTFVLKSIRKFAEADHGAGVNFLPPFKDEEDERFGATLFTNAVENREVYREYIDRFISSDWDPERLAFMDIVIMITALTEILTIPGIPVPVSLNEYIEIANTYSTRRSGPFINGILYSVLTYLAKEGKLLKPFQQEKNN